MLTIAVLLLSAFAAQAGSVVDAIVTDPLTGVAMSGYDPVTYFTESSPEQGKPDFEYDWGGVAWYFASAANRDVFIRNPGIYAPQFGGHCAMSLSRGFLSDGKPLLYAVDGLKLYLFYSSGNRDAFLAARQSAIASAEDNWPKLSPQLTGPMMQAASALPAAEAAVASDVETAAPVPGLAAQNALAEAAGGAAIAPDGAASHVQHQ